MKYIDINLSFNFFLSCPFEWSENSLTGIENYNSNVKVSQRRCYFILVILYSVHLGKICNDAHRFDFTLPLFQDQLLDFFQLCFHFGLIAADNADVEKWFSSKILGHGKTNSIGSARDHSPRSFFVSCLIIFDILLIKPVPLLDAMSDLVSPQIFYHTP